MSEAHIESSSHLGSAIPAPVMLGPGAPDGIAVILQMRPERVFGGEEEGGGNDRPIPSLEKTYRTASWFFASDFLDRAAEIAASECSGFKVRPVQVAVTYELDDKAYRHVDLILDSFDNAFRAL